MSLLNKIKTLLSGKEKPREGDAARALQIANAVLLVEISHADFETDPNELKTASARLARRYSLDPGQADALLEEALAEHRQSVSLHDHLR